LINISSFSAIAYDTIKHIEMGNLNNWFFIFGGIFRPLEYLLSNRRERHHRGVVDLIFLAASALYQYTAANMPGEPEMRAAGGSSRHEASGARE